MVNTSVLPPIFGRITAKYLRVYVSDEDIILILLSILAIIISLVIWSGIAKYLRRRRELANHHEKIQVYQQSVSRDPDDPLINFKLGMEYQALNQHREAIACFRHALNFNKDSQLADDIHYQLGLSYVATAEKDFAFEEYNQILKNQEKAQSLLVEVMKIKRNNQAGKG